MWHLEIVAKQQNMKKRKVENPEITKRDEIAEEDAIHVEDLSFRFRSRTEEKKQQYRSEYRRFLEEKKSEWTKMQNTAMDKFCLFPNGTVNIQGIYDFYLMENSANCIPLDDHLLFKLKFFSNKPFSMYNMNPGSYIFCSYIWDVVLKTQFLCEDRSTSFEIRRIKDTFIEEMEPYINSRMDGRLFKPCALRLHYEGFLYSETDNYYEVPAILRVLAPTYERLAEGGKFYMKTCLQGLPHSVIMKPFEYFKLHDIPRLRNTRIVSSIRASHSTQSSFKVIAYVHACL